MPHDHRILGGVESHRHRVLVLGISAGLIGAAIAGWVGLEWLTARVSHEVWTLVAATAILFSIQLIGLWLLSGLVVASYRDASAEFEVD